MLAAKASESTPPSLIEIVLASSPSYVVPEFNCNVALSTVNAFSTDEACPVKVPTIELPVIIPLELMFPLAVICPVTVNLLLSNVDKLFSLVFICFYYQKV